LRVFVKQVGDTPARYVERLRVEAVRRLLEGSDRRLEAIAHATGFGNADVMRQAFQRHACRRRPSDTGRRSAGRAGKALAAA
jgi:transcriptional regulator GlxA family with amidase domain